MLTFQVADTNEMDGRNAQDDGPTDSNPLQENFDGDLLGDVCDLEDDNGRGPSQLAMVGMTAASYAARS